MTELNEFFVKELYWGKWDGEGHYRWGAYLFRCVFSGSRATPLPVTSQVVDKVIKNTNGADTLLRLLPSNARGVRKHRVFVYCYKCGTWVPAGRVHQHKC